MKQAVVDTDVRERGTTAMRDEVDSMQMPFWHRPEAHCDGLVHGRPYDSCDDASEYWLRAEADDWKEEEEDEDCEEEKEEEEEDREEDVDELEDELNDERERLLLDDDVLLMREDVDDTPQTALQAA